MADCTEQRQAYEEADAVAREAVIQRQTAQAGHDVASQQASDARDALAIAEQAEEESADALSDAIANANSSLEASQSAYQAWVDCQLMDSADQASPAAASVTVKAKRRARKR